MTVNEGVFRDILRLFIWFPFRWIVNILSVNAAFSLFKLIGDLHFLYGGRKKEKVSINMHSILGDDIENINNSARKYFENHYVDRLHIFLYPKLHAMADLERFVQIENIDLLHRALNEGRGALIVQPHFGPVQITLLALALAGYKPLQIGYSSDKGLSAMGKQIAFRYRLKYEAMLPAPILPADEYLGKVYKYLKSGGVVLTTGDGAGGGTFLGEHKALRFLGGARAIPLGPAAWALRTGAAFIPTFIIAESCNKFRIVFEEPIKGSNGGLEKDKIQITERFLAIAERYIKKYPHCWHFWDEI